MIGFSIPSPCTHRRFALEGLKTFGMRVNPSARNFDPWDTFRLALKTHRTNVVILDEVQHAFETATFVQAQQLLDALKHLVQMPDWPVRLVLAGVSPLAEYLSSDKQIVNRMTPIPFDKLTGKEGQESTKTLLRKIIVEHAAMSMDQQLVDATMAAAPGKGAEEVGLSAQGDSQGSGVEDDFIKRLHHACDSEFGSIVETIRAAVENAMVNGIDVVSVADFADVYERVSGCLPDQNLFECPDWADIERGKAFVRVVDLKEAMKREKSRSRRKQKTYKFGDRP